MAAKKRVTSRRPPKLKPDGDGGGGGGGVASPMPHSQRPYSGYRRRIALLLPAFLLLFVVGFASVYWNRSGSFVVDEVSPALYSIEVVREFPHDPQAFTQGLLYGGNDTLFESTGLHGQSSVRKVALQSGKVEAMQNMDRSYFGEGLTLLDERLFQVTWLQKTGFIYDRNNLSKFEEFTHEMQDGWGLATDGKILFGSDGSSTLYQIDPHNFRVIDKQVVRYRTHEVHNLNELEYINGEIWANIWQVNIQFSEYCRRGEILTLEYGNLTWHDKFPLCFNSQFLGKNSHGLSSKCLHTVILSLITKLLGMQNAICYIVGIS